MKEYVVPPNLDGSRLDKAAIELVSGLSRARVKRAIEEGSVRLNGRWTPKGGLVKSGDVIMIEEGNIADPDAPAVASPEAPLNVVLERADLLVVDKPRGQATAPLRPGETGTLANALVGHYPELAGIGYGPREPGIVHRIDGGTSGLVLVARTAAAFSALREALQAEKISKRYELVTKSDGLPDEGSIEYPLADHPKDQRRVLACVHPRDVMRNSPRSAFTAYRVIERKNDYAHVEVRVAKALRHQIRVHFATYGFPLVGDVLYGGIEVPGLNRHALHASRISFEGNDAIAPFDVSSPLPKELAALLGV
ncbi:RluA family pseudouridine synthase [soil metagenome]